MWKVFEIEKSLLGWKCSRSGGELTRLLKRDFSPQWGVPHPDKFSALFFEAQNCILSFSVSFYSFFALILFYCRPHTRTRVSEKQKIKKTGLFLKDSMPKKSASIKYAAYLHFKTCLNSPKQTQNTAYL